MKQLYYHLGLFFFIGCMILLDVSQHLQCKTWCHKHFNENKGDIAVHHTPLGNIELNYATEDKDTYGNGTSIELTSDM